MFLLTRHFLRRGHDMGWSSRSCWPCLGAFYAKPADFAGQGVHCKPHGTLTSDMYGPVWLFCWKWRAPKFWMATITTILKMCWHLVLVSVKETRVYVVHHCTVYFEPFSIVCWTLAQRVQVFFVSGFATLTLLVNATTCGLLLKYLGLTKPPEAGWKVSASSESLEWPSCFSFLQVKGL